MKRLVAVAQFALCFVFVFCNIGDGQTRPSELLGQWVLARANSGGWCEKAEYLKDGTGVDCGRSITWKVVNGRLFEVGNRISAEGMYYKVSGYELHLWNDEDTAIYVKKGKLEEFKAKQAAAAEAEKAKAEAEKAKRIAESKRALEQLPKFTDSRDGKVYRKVTIGGKTWMAENLNFAVDGSKCYENNAGNCEKYGRLYNWATALKACPAGFHLPTDDEWTALENAVGGRSTAGTKLKSAAGWYEYGDGTDVYGTNDYGFSALPGGVGVSKGDFGSADYLGRWWSATERDANDAWDRSMYCVEENVSCGYFNKTFLFSVRCVQD